MAVLLTWLKRQFVLGNRKSVCEGSLTSPDKTIDESKKEKREAYQRTITRIKNTLKKIPDDGEKLAFLDYTITTLKRDIIGSKRAEIFYNEKEPELINLFPSFNRKIDSAIKAIH